MITRFQMDGPRIEDAVIRKGLCVELLKFFLFDIFLVGFKKVDVIDIVVLGGQQLHAFELFAGGQVQGVFACCQGGGGRCGDQFLPLA